MRSATEQSQAASSHYETFGNQLEPSLVQIFSHFRCFVLSSASLGPIMATCSVWHVGLLVVPQGSAPSELSDSANVGSDFTISSAKIKSVVGYCSVFFVAFPLSITFYARKTVAISFLA